jgi:CRP/FNR family transcriptional regulator, nitrogen oxide reductase regulator
VIRFSQTMQLHSIPAFQHLSEDILNAMASIACVYSLKPGEVLLYQGDEIHSFYVVQCGGVRLVDYTADGQSVSLKIYGPGDVFGLLAISGSYPHPTQIEAVHQSLIIGIDGHDVRQMMMAHPLLALTAIDLLTKHVHEAHRRIRHMAVEKVDRRLARALLQFSDKFGFDDGGCINIDLPITQRDLAEFTGTTVETINRTLTAWCKQGIVACSHKHIDILDRDALANIAENRLVAQTNSA